jgi:hypothetical protein
MDEIVTNPDESRIRKEFQGNEQVPNSTPVLVLGILSIIFCWCIGIPGLIMGITGLILGSRSRKIYRAEPGRYNLASFKNLNAGYICSLIGTILSALYFMLILMIIIFGVAFGAGLLPFIPWEDILRDL